MPNVSMLVGARDRYGDSYVLLTPNDNGLGLPEGPVDSKSTQTALPASRVKAYPTYVDQDCKIDAKTMTQSGLSGMTHLGAIAPQLAKHIVDNRNRVCFLQPNQVVKNFVGDRKLGHAIEGDEDFLQNEQTCFVDLGERSEDQLNNLLQGAPRGTRWVKVTDLSNGHDLQQDNTELKGTPVSPQAAAYARALRPAMGHHPASFLRVLKKDGTETVAYDHAVYFIRKLVNDEKNPLTIPQLIARDLKESDRGMMRPSTLMGRRRVTRVDIDDREEDQPMIHDPIQDANFSKIGREFGTVINAFDVWVNIFGKRNLFSNRLKELSGKFEAELQSNPQLKARFDSEDEAGQLRIREAFYRPHMEKRGGRTKDNVGDAAMKSLFRRDRQTGLVPDVDVRTDLHFIMVNYRRAKNIPDNQPITFDDEFKAFMEDQLQQEEFLVYMEYLESTRQISTVKDKATGDVKEQEDKNAEGLINLHNRPEFKGYRKGVEKTVAGKRYAVYPTLPAYLKEDIRKKFDEYKGKTDKELWQVMRQKAQEKFVVMQDSGGLKQVCQHYNELLGGLVNAYSLESNGKKYQYGVVRNQKPWEEALLLLESLESVMSVLLPDDMQASLAYLATGASASFASTEEKLPASAYDLRAGLLEGRTNIEAIQEINRIFREMGLQHNGVDIIFDYNNSTHNILLPCYSGEEKEGTRIFKWLQDIRIFSDIIDRVTTRPYSPRPGTPAENNKGKPIVQLREENSQKQMVDKHLYHRVPLLCDASEFLERLQHARRQGLLSRVAPVDEVKEEKRRRAEYKAPLREIADLTPQQFREAKPVFAVLNKISSKDEREKYLEEFLPKGYFGFADDNILHRACLVGAVEVVRYLFENYPDVSINLLLSRWNSAGLTPWHMLLADYPGKSLQEQEQIFDLMCSAIEKHAKHDIIWNSTNTPTNSACTRGHFFRPRDLLRSDAMRQRAGQLNAVLQEKLNLTTKYRGLRGFVSMSSGLPKFDLAVCESKLSRDKIYQQMMGSLAYTDHLNETVLRWILDTGRYPHMVDWTLDSVERKGETSEEKRNYWAALSSEEKTNALFNKVHAGDTVLGWAAKHLKPRAVELVLNKLRERLAGGGLEDPRDIARQSMVTSVSEYVNIENEHKQTPLARALLTISHFPDELKGQANLPRLNEACETIALLVLAGANIDLALQRANLTREQLETIDPLLLQALNTKPAAPEPQLAASAPRRRGRDEDDVQTSAASSSASSSSSSSLSAPTSPLSMSTTNMMTSLSRSTSSSSSSSSSSSAVDPAVAAEEKRLTGMLLRGDIDEDDKQRMMKKFMDKLNASSVDPVDEYAKKLAAMLKAGDIDESDAQVMLKKFRAKLQAQGGSVAQFSAIGASSSSSSSASPQQPQQPRFGRQYSTGGRT